MSAVLVALDSVGIDPLGADRPESVYSGSALLFPPRGGVLVETDVVGGRSDGAIECALTYASIFSGVSAVREHGLVRALGLREGLLRDLVRRGNLFRRFDRPCLANAVFPFHVREFGSSHVEAPDCPPMAFRGSPVRLHGRPKHGFAELFTLAEINQNIFVWAAIEAGVPLRTHDDVRAGRALTSTMTHELERDFGFDLPVRTPEEAADVLASLAAEHDFVFYKYQVADLVSHTGRVEEARAVWATIERFVGRLRPRVETLLITSDHGHLEQLATHRGHPKSKVPTWCFGPRAEEMAPRLATPEGIYQALTA